MSLFFSEEELTALGQSIWEERRHRWFHDSEIFLLLSIPKTLGIPILTSLDVKPKDGDAFLFHVTHDIKDEDYDWKRKKVNEKTEKKGKRNNDNGEEGKPTLQESHDHILINQEKKITSVYIKSASNEFFKRRIYKLDHRRTYYYQLSHYRDDQVDTVAANKGKPIDPRVGYLVYSYLLKPEIFVKDLPSYPTIPHYSPPPAPLSSKASPYHSPPVAQSRQQLPAVSFQMMDPFTMQVDDHSGCEPPVTRLGKRNKRSTTESMTNRFLSRNSNSRDQLKSMLSASVSIGSQPQLKKVAMETENPWSQEYLQYHFATGGGVLPVTMTYRQPVNNQSSSWDDYTSPGNTSLMLSPETNTQHKMHPGLSTEDILSPSFRDMSISFGDLNLNFSQLKIYDNEQLQNLSYGEIKAAHKQLEQFLFLDLVQQEISQKAHNPELLYETNEHGYNLLHICCQQEYFYPLIQQIVQLLPPLLYTPTEDEAKDSPLLLAVAAGHREIVNYLLEQLERNNLYQEIGRFNKQGKNIVQIAIKHKHMQLAEELQQRYVNLPYQPSPSNEGMSTSETNKQEEEALLQLTYDTLESPIEKIAFAERLLSPQQADKVKALRDTLSPEDLKQLEAECRLISSKKQYMIKKKYCHLRELYYRMLNEMNQITDLPPQPKQDIPMKKTVVAVQNLPLIFNQQEVVNLFAQFGQLIRSDFPVNPSSNMSEGNAEFEYTTEEAASLARQQMNGFVLNGNRLLVDAGNDMIGQPDVQDQPYFDEAVFAEDMNFDEMDFNLLSVGEEGTLPSKKGVNVKQELYNNVVKNRGLEHMKSETNSTNMSK